MEHAAAFFDHRFKDAFPGVRELTVFDQRRDVAHRLGVLLRPPLTASLPEGDGGVSPFWWTRGVRDLHVTQWHQLKPDVFLMDTQELRVSRIAAIPGAVYWQHFLYVECAPQQPTGLYRHTPEQIARAVGLFGFHDEEYCVYRFRLFTRREYDDGGYERRGRVQQFQHSPDLRIRYLTKYNFLIVQSQSPAIGNFLVQRHLTAALNECLENELALQDLASWLLRLPRERTRAPRREEE
jgi:hypothetical protein